MVLLIDANIILDVLLNRPEFVKESSLVWKLCETEQAKGYISALTFANLVYIMRKQLTPEKIEDVLQRLGLIFDLQTSLLPTCLRQLRCIGLILKMQFRASPLSGSMPTTSLPAMSGTSPKAALWHLRPQSFWLGCEPFRLPPAFFGGSFVSF